MRDKNTSVRVCGKNAGGLMREGGRICGTLRYLPMYSMTNTCEQLYVLKMCTPSHSHFDQSRPSGSEVLTESAVPPCQLLEGNINMKD